MFGKNKSKEADAPTPLQKIDSARKVEVLWTRSLGGGEGKLWIRQAPALAEGRVYASNRSGRVFAFDALSGKLLWEVKTKLELTGGPGVGAGRLVLGSIDGDVLALNADNGAELWRTKVTSEVISRPLIAQGMAVVRSNDGRVYGLDLADGQRKWVYDRGLPPLTIRGNANPVAARDAVVLGFEDGTLITLRIIDGSEIWERQVAVPDGRTELERMADIDGDIQVGLNEVYAQSAKGEVMAIDLNNGQPLWIRDIKGYTGLSLLGDKVIAVDGNGLLLALDRNSGSGVWRQDALLHRWLSSPAATAQQVVVGDFEGYLHWFDGSTGAAVARTHVGGDPIRATPQVSSDGVVYALTTDGKLGAYRLAEH